MTDPRPTGSRSPEVKALTALLCGAAACLLAAVLFPMSARAPVTIGWWTLGLAVVLACGTYWLGDRVPRWTLVVESSVITIINSFLVTRAATTGGAVIDAFAYIWLAVYTAAFFPRWWLAFATLVSASFGIALLFTDLPGMFTAWLLLTISVMTAAAVVSQVSRIMQRDIATDALTGALNRSGLAEAARRLHLRRRRTIRQVTVAALDLDGFKAVNDQTGHAAGDRLLADATAAWRAVLRHEDVLARVGGDEFIVLMPNTSSAEAAAVLERLRDSHPVAWSAGLASWQTDEPLEACIQRADRELYAVKHAR
ncbi:MAG TPA: GGDEF domain-containing protein [Baekduia sp.]|uniref:GGDEF domain-containing protein n=1 Tax=Baekduia sp. TaxID=2600305 RepID=UPI002D79628D|nr:GGDEF domain-containing protein [Baekduia sp.]HET6506591.1 GGDEF domain-containing protein [Baekduia sp.]